MQCGNTMTVIVQRWQMAERSDGYSDEPLLVPCARKKKLQGKMVEDYYWMGAEENIGLFS